MKDFAQVFLVAVTKVFDSFLLHRNFENRAPPNFLCKIEVLSISTKEYFQVFFTLVSTRMPCSDKDWYKKFFLADFVQGNSMKIQYIDVFFPLVKLLNEMFFVFSMWTLFVLILLFHLLQLRVFQNEISSRSQEGTSGMQFSESCQK